MPERLLRFVKMHGAGNDYVYIDCIAERGPADDAGADRLQETPAGPATGTATVTAVVEAGGGQQPEGVCGGDVGVEHDGLRGRQAMWNSGVSIAMVRRFVGDQ
jgi:hypothetical protein